MIDRDLAELYQVRTKVLNQSVKRNIERFPEHFMFRLTEKEYDSLRSQIATLEIDGNLRSRNVTARLDWGGRRSLPYVFTEQGVSMLSGILRSRTAIKVSIQIMDTFVSMRKFISKNAEIFRRLDFVERKHIEYDEKFEKVFDAIEDKSFVKRQGIFFDGQIFDAYKFVSDLIRTAEKSIVLVDNYIDESVLTLFTKRKKEVRVKIFTKNISKQLKLDLKKHNAQYDPIEIIEFKRSHDRFLIIDDETIYHFGASLKDLGKKWFAFSKFKTKDLEILNKLKCS